MHMLLFPCQQQHLENLARAGGGGGGHLLEWLLVVGVDVSFPWWFLPCSRGSPNPDVRSRRLQAVVLVVGFLPQVACPGERRQGAIFLPCGSRLWGWNRRGTFVGRSPQSRVESPCPKKSLSVTYLAGINRNKSTASRRPS
jgi:hypothetical protein